MLESSLAPISPHIEERLELLESMMDREGEGMEENNRHSKRSAEPLAEQVTKLHNKNIRKQFMQESVYSIGGT